MMVRVERVRYSHQGGWYRRIKKILSHRLKACGIFYFHRGSQAFGIHKTQGFNHRSRRHERRRLIKRLT